MCVLGIRASVTVVIRLDHISGLGLSDTSGQNMYMHGYSGARAMAARIGYRGLLEFVQDY